MAVVRIKLSAKWYLVHDGTYIATRSKSVFTGWLSYNSTTHTYEEFATEALLYARASDFPPSSRINLIAIGDSQVKGLGSGDVSWAHIVEGNAASRYVATRGLSGDTFAGIQSRIAAEVVGAACGKNIATEGEFQSIGSGWETDSDSVYTLATPETSNAIHIENGVAASGYIRRSQACIANTNYKMSMKIFDTGSGGMFTGVGNSAVDILGVLGASLDTGFISRSFNSGAYTAIYPIAQNLSASIGDSNEVDDIQIREDIPPEICMVSAGINDINNGKTAVQVLADATTVANTLVAAGISPMFVGIGPWSSYSQSTTAKQVESDSFKSSLAQFCIDNEYLHVDVYGSLEDPSNAGNLNPIYDAGDQLHYNSLAQSKVADLVDFVLYS